MTECSVEYTHSERRLVSRDTSCLRKQSSWPGYHRILAWFIVSYIAGVMIVSMLTGTPEAGLQTSMQREQRHAYVAAESPTPAARLFLCVLQVDRSVELASTAESTWMRRCSGDRLMYGSRAVVGRSVTGPLKAGFQRLSRLLLLLAARMKDGGARWLLLADEAVFMLLENIERVTKITQRDAPVLYLGNMVHESPAPAWNRFSAGVLLHETAVMRLSASLQHAPTLFSHVAALNETREDLLLGVMLAAVGVNVTDSTSQLRFSPLPVSTLLELSETNSQPQSRTVNQTVMCCSDKMASFGGNSVNQMLSLEFILYRMKVLKCSHHSVSTSPRT